MRQFLVTREEALILHNLGNEETKKKIENNFPELFHKEKRWGDFGKLNGYFVDGYTEIEMVTNEKSHYDNKNTNPTEKECEMDIAMCQLRQWRDKANGESIFDWCDWSDLSQRKYCIYRVRDKINTMSLNVNYQELALKTEELMNQFFKDHKTLIHTAFGLTINK